MDVGNNHVSITWRVSRCYVITQWNLAQQFKHQTQIYKDQHGGTSLRVWKKTHKLHRCNLGSAWQ